jgi:hypothetical protein
VGGGGGVGIDGDLTVRVCVRMNTRVRNEQRYQRQEVQKIDGLSSSLFQCFVMSAVSGGKQVIAFVNFPINLPNAVFELDCLSFRVLFGQTRLQINKITS